MPSPRSKRKFFSKIYDEHVTHVYRFIFLKVGSQEIGQDLTAEAFLRFWQALDSGIKINNPRAFIYKIARNLIVDHFRKTRPVLIEPERIQIENGQINPFQEAVLGADIQDLQAALAKIPDDYQTILIWYYLDEISVSEIATMLEKSENAIRVMVHRALNALREVIGDRHRR